MAESKITCKADTIQSHLVSPQMYRRPLVRRGLEETLADLQTDYVDLLLLHWPFPMQPGKPLVWDNETTLAETWRVLEELKREKLVRSIGVSNFDEAQLTDLLSKTLEKPVVNQIEIHPAFVNAKLVKFCKAESIVPVAWGPLDFGKTKMISCLTCVVSIVGLHISPRDRMTSNIDLGVKYEDPQYYSLCGFLDLGRTCVSLRSGTHIPPTHTHTKSISQKKSSGIFGT